MTDPNTPQWQPPTGNSQFGNGAPQWQPPAPPPAKSGKGSEFPTWVKIIVGVVGAFILLGVGVAAGGGPAKVETRNVAGPQTTVTATATVNTVSTVTATPPAPTATVTTTFTPQPVVAFSSGQYAVPAEVQPGSYHTDGGSQCYYAVLADLTGGIDSIISNDNFSGPTTITIPNNAAGIQASGDCSWSKV